MTSSSACRITSPVVPLRTSSCLKCSWHHPQARALPLLISEWHRRHYMETRNPGFIPNPPSTAPTVSLGSINHAKDLPPSARALIADHHPAPGSGNPVPHTPEPARRELREGRVHVRCRAHVSRLLGQEERDGELLTWDCADSFRLPSTQHTVC